MNTGEPDVSAITEERMRTLLGTTRPYTIVLLRPGPNRHTEGADAIVWQHGRRNMALRDDGRLAIVCPVRDEDLNGVGIFALEPDEVRAVMDADPGVRAGVFTYEVHASRSFPGDALP